MGKVCNRCGDVIGNEMAIVDDDGNWVHGSELECVVVLQERIAELEEKNHALDQIARDAKDANKYLDEVLAENAELDSVKNALANAVIQINICTDLSNKRWEALNNIYENGEKHNANWCKRKAQEGLGIK